MKYLLLILLAVSAPLYAADGWLKDYPAALKKAEEEGKALIIDFTDLGT